MRAYKVVPFVFLAFFSFQVRESQQRSLKEDDAVSDNIRDIESLYDQKCACYPSTKSGILVNKYVSPDEEQERLVVYFYKTGKSQKVTVFIPSLKKQRILPELTFDAGDKLETIAPNEYFNLLPDNDLYFAKLKEGTDLNSVTPTVSNQEYVVDNNLADVPGLDMTSAPLGDYRPEITDSISVEDSNEFPLQLQFDLASEPSSGTVSSPDTLDEEIPYHTDNNTNQNFNLSLGNTQQQANTYVTEPNYNSNQDLKRKDQPILGTLGNYVNTHFSPTKPIVESSPNKLSQIKVNSFERPIYQTPDHKESSIGDIFPGYIGLVPDSSSVEFSTNQYKYPTFDEWFIQQTNSIRSQKSSMSKAIDFQLLRLLLMKSFRENGIKFSSNGELYDSNGKVLDMANLKLRPVLLGDPVDYEKLTATGKCMISYNIPYLEAVLITSDYPPKILAIIPLRKVFISKANNYISPISYRKKSCAKGNCHGNIDYRSGSPEEDQSDNDIDTEANSENLSVKSQNTVDKSADETIAENEPIFKKDVTFQDDDIRKRNNLFIKTSTNPIRIKDNSLHHPLSSNGQSDFDVESTSLDGENYLDERKPSEYFDVPQEIAKPDEDYDTLAFRIVGGNPATSSGTPVSSKGRSGFGA